MRNRDLTLIRALRSTKQSSTDVPSSRVTRIDFSATVVRTVHFTPGNHLFPRSGNGEGSKKLA